jgi:hypothetical protein
LLSYYFLIKEIKFSARESHLNGKGFSEEIFPNIDVWVLGHYVTNVLVLLFGSMFYESMLDILLLILRSF